MRQRTPPTRKHTDEKLKRTHLKITAKFQSSANSGPIPPKMMSSQDPERRTKSRLHSRIRFLQVTVNCVDIGRQQEFTTTSQGTMTGGGLDWHLYRRCIGRWVSLAAAMHRLKLFDNDIRQHPLQFSHIAPQ
jgi:hypothetical protein